MITPFYAALLTLMLIALSINVILGRWKTAAGLGDMGDLSMQRRIRAQANFVEYTPMFILLLGYAEYNHLWSWMVHVIALVYIAGRFMHAYSLLKAENYRENRLTAYPVWRTSGMLCTFTTLLVLSGVLIVQAVLV